MVENKPAVPGGGNGNNQPPQPSGVKNPDEKKNQEQQKERKEELGPEYQVRLRRGGDKEIFANGRGYRFTAKEFTKIPEKDFLHKDIQNAKDNFIVKQPQPKTTGVNNGN